MKILLVEDSEGIRARLRALIGDWGGLATVSEAVGEREAVGDACRVRPDLVILDIKLAQGNGLEVLQSVKRCSPETRVAVLTSHVEAPYRRKCLESGADWFFDKAEGLDGIGWVLTEMMVARLGVCDARH